MNLILEWRTFSVAVAQFSWWHCFSVKTVILSSQDPLELTGGMTGTKEMMRDFLMRLTVNIMLRLSGTDFAIFLWPCEA